MEMSKKLEKLRWRAEDRIYRKDEWVRQDTDELLGLEQKLNEMELSEKDRKVVDDYTVWNPSRTEWDTFCMRLE